MQEILIESTLDHTLQPSLFFHPGTDRAVPLVVGLHTWSYDRFNQEKNYLPLCREYGFALLLPEFRGPNLESNPRKLEACGTALARRDVIDAVEYVCTNYAIDRDSIFLLGCSGGGHMALLTAETAPERFRAVEVWCPVSDLVKWHAFQPQCRRNYAPHIEACLGGTPEEVPAEYVKRSPARQVEALKSLPVSIHHGRHDPVVPFRHSAELAEKLEKTGNPRVYLDIFDGGHEQNPAHSFEWFAKLAGKSKDTVEITG
jgi:dipeptidyl aminopeptidase/acylaminoacyl peptidase